MHLFRSFHRGQYCQRSGTMSRITISTLIVACKLLSRWALWFAEYSSWLTILGGERVTLRTKFWRQLLAGYCSARSPAKYQYCAFVTILQHLKPTFSLAQLVVACCDDTYLEAKVFRGHEARSSDIFFNVLQPCNVISMTTTSHQSSLTWP